MKRSKAFKPRSRLLLQLGDQLIRNEGIALLELIKNSYDACATKVYVKMDKVDKCDEGTITIEDNGIGMDIDIISDVWMEPGSDYKEQMYKKKQFTHLHNRLPLGEKGIGRFAVHKFGHEIELISKTKKGKEVYLKIDWKVFEASKYMEEIPINILEREKPKVFSNRNTGTMIIIKKLKSTWSRAMVREVFRAINSLCSPFNTPDSFKVNFDIDKKEWIEGLLSWKEIKDYSLFRVNCEIEGNEIKTFIYEFNPWPAMKKLKSRIISERSPEVEKRLRMVYKDKVPIDLSPFKIGRIKFEAFIFDRDSRVLSLGVMDKKGLKDYLDANGGIRVYRDGIRVYDYGEPGNDWLNLGGRRVNIPAKRISNNLIMGAVHINRDDSSDLIEKTNREGFIEGEAYNRFSAAILYALGIVEGLRNIDKDKIRTFYGPTPSSEPVISFINDLKDVVEKKIKDTKLKDEVSKYLTRIENDYRTINETLLRSAGAGLSLSVVIHEVEKIVAELKHVIEQEKTNERIISLIKHLSEILESYGKLVRKTDYKYQNIKEIIDQALFNIEFRREIHKIQVIKDYQKSMENSKIKCARNLVIGSILNIIDNSIWWFDYSGTKNKKIYLSISNEFPEHLCIIVADNGPGFTLPTEEITKPFVSGKPDGMGLGLHIVEEVMKMQNGKVLFPEKDDFALPEEFKSGAIIVLAFKKEE